MTQTEPEAPTCNAVLDIIIIIIILHKGYTFFIPSAFTTHKNICIFIYDFFPEIISRKKMDFPGLYFLAVNDKLVVIRNPYRFTVDFVSCLRLDLVM